MNAKRRGGLTCRFGDPRKENCDMLCRPLRAVMVGRRYAIILPDRSSICCSLTKSHSEQVSDHFCFFPSLFNFIFSPRNTTRKIKSSPVGEPEEVTKCETKKKKKKDGKKFFTIKLAPVLLHCPVPDSEGGLRSCIHSHCHKRRHL